MTQPPQQSTEAETSSQHPAQLPRYAWVGLAMLILVVSELAALYLPFSFFKIIAIASLVAIFLFAWKQLKLREVYLIGIGVVLAILAFATLDDAAEWTLEALNRAAYLASFILLMALLREGALHSRSVVDLGRFLTLQPPQRRFVAVFSGSHVLAVMINLGALSLLAPIVQRGVRADLPPGAPLDEVAMIRERRQLIATLRGFSWFLVWAPTAVTQAVMPTLMEGIDALKLVGLGLQLALLMLLFSWCEDWLRWRGTGRRIRSQGLLQATPTPQFPKRAARNFGLVCALLFSLSVACAWLSGATIVTGVMAAAPVVTLIWVLIQQKPGQRIKGTGERLDQITFHAMPNYIREMVFVACAGFIGTLGAQLVPIEEIAVAIGLEAAPGWLVLWCISVSVWVAGQIGLSPITMAVFLGSIIAQIPVLPVDMTHAALAIATGTAISTGGAPFSAGALMLSRATGHPPATLTWRWNGHYTFMCMAILIAVYMWLEP
ncbi:MAG: hypothetical protein HRU27_15790 [Rhizobiaceae bacterium]|nr:hypothetical protein [Rhizobiaceae bacterium]